MIDPNGLFGAFVLAVAHLRELQRVPLDEFSPAKAHELQRATDEVDSQVALFLTRSFLSDHFALVIDAATGGNN